MVNSEIPLSEIEFKLFLLKNQDSDESEYLVATKSGLEVTSSPIDVEND